MQVQPNCKINIGLRVLRKRPDGYHDLETIFYPIYGLHDVLDVVPVSTPGQVIDFVQDGITIDCDIHDNLIVRCYQQMAAQYPRIGSVKVHFTKLIPFGAGLGGGSSDAAHMAIVLNQLFDLGLSREQLAQAVRPLGADCPFFIYNTPCFATGIGDILRPIAYDLSGKRMVMIKPNVAVSTRDAYAGIVPYEGTFDETVNDFETTVFAKFPELADIKKHLLDAGAYYAAMSGSGSTIFGLFELDAEGRTLAQLRRLHTEFASMIIFDDTLG